eukprot:CAMPEP_0170751312 /NCGR_PEP_ID=MMETSP0437-20130122/11387_1 /TAXON_ID=0 /ORGANISM="Sexangularia sp." /LENGTH=417 /DNA_ID=CAMNT_0011090345 /DNA_START=124 /DNA_END=1377 /DNA_ORIENTATION=-
MALVKPKKYDVADSNIANLGTELERQVKKASAETETAWAGVGSSLGLRVWRIEKFKVVAWPENLYGQFYDGDSYIVLSIRERSSDKPKNKVFREGKWVEIDAPWEYDVHFWLGEYTTQDEAGTAAYKTVELDTLLDDLPTQHREVQGHESELFLSYFNNEIQILSGGVETGFRHVETDAEKARARLLHVKGLNLVRVIEVPLSYESLNSGDVFILDDGHETVIQWNGKKANRAERVKGTEVREAIRKDRKGKAMQRINDEGDEDDDFWELIGGKGPIKGADEGGADADAEVVKKLYRLSDASGKMEFTLEAEGDAVSKDKLDTEDAFIFDAGYTVFAWVGRKTTAEERRCALGYAQHYLTAYNRPAFLPIMRILEGGEPKTFWQAFDMHHKEAKLTRTSVSSFRRVDDPIRKSMTEE